MSRSTGVSLISQLASGLEYLITRREVVGVDVYGNKYLRQDTSHAGFQDLFDAVQLLRKSLAQFCAPCTSV